MISDRIWTKTTSIDGSDLSRSRRFLLLFAGPESLSQLHSTGIEKHQDFDCGKNKLNVKKILFDHYDIKPPSAARLKTSKSRSV